MVAVLDKSQVHYIGIYPPTGDYEFLDNQPAIGGVVLTKDTTKADLDLDKVFQYRGQVASYNKLPKKASIGDTYNVLDTGENYAWNGSSWDLLTGTEAVYWKNNKLESQGSTLTIDADKNQITNLVIGDITDITATATELNYVDGVTSNIQDQLDSKQNEFETGVALELSDMTKNYDDSVEDYTTPFIVDENGIVTTTTQSIAYISTNVEKTLFKFKITELDGTVASSFAAGDNVMTLPESGFMFQCLNSGENKIVGTLLKIKPSGQEPEILTTFDMDLNDWYYTLFEKTNEDNDNIYYNYYITKDLESLGTAYPIIIDKSYSQRLNILSLSENTYSDFATSYYIDNDTTKHLIEMDKKTLNVSVDNDTIKVNGNNQLYADIQVVDDNSITSTTLGWSASKLNGLIGDIESTINAIRGV